MTPVKTNLMISLLFAGAVSASASTFLSPSTPGVDGSVDGGYTLLNESIFANTPGGQSGSSDLLGEASGRHRWNDGGSVNEDIGTDGTHPRGDIQSIYATWDRDNLYLALVGPTLQLNDFTGNGTSGVDDDQGDVFIAIETGEGRSIAASSGLASDAGWGSDTTAGFGNAKAVDFTGWSPDYVVAVQYVDNGGGGGGYAELVNLGTSAVSGEGQGQANGGFDWASNLGNTLEFQIPWTSLGFSGGFDPSQPENVGTFRLTAYTTANFAFFDTFDQGPGIGQGFGNSFEQIGDSPGDDDTGGLLGPSDGGSIPGGSNAGSNFVSGGPVSTFGVNDQIDTLGGNLNFSVGSIPEPETFTFAVFGLICLRFFRRNISR